jgi:hypothetical protein
MQEHEQHTHIYHTKLKEEEKSKQAISRHLSPHGSLAEQQAP